MHCLDELTILELVQGGLSRQALARVDEHVDRCAQCREVVLEVARTRSGEREIGGLRAGAKLGRYVIIDVVGRGAFGVVYRAHDPQLQRKVAIKLLRADGDRGVEERLLREATAMARLSHPHVVAVYETGRSDGATFIAMELVEGMTLRQWLQTQRSASNVIDWRAVVARFVQAGRGLAAAHEAGLVHRDFKPDNVLIGADGRARVTDFGLARGGREVRETTAAAQAGAAQSGVAHAGAVRSSAEQSPPQIDALFETMTATGSVLGTPAYMAPEQLRGEPADARSDQFSFCIALYEALCGRRPFEGTSLSALQDSMSSAPAALPQSRPAHLPRWLWRVLARGLSRQPEQRYPSMRQLLSALQPVGRNRWRWWAAAAAVLGVVSGTALLALASQESPARCEGGEQLAGEVWSPARADKLSTAFTSSRAPFAGRAEQAVRAHMADWSERWAQAHGGICRATRVRGDQSEPLLDVRMQCLERQRQEVDALLTQLQRADAEMVARAPQALASLSPLSECAQREMPGSQPAPSAAQKPQLAAFERARADVIASLATGKYAAAAEAGERLLQKAEQINYEPAMAAAQLVYGEALARDARLKQAEEHALQAVWAAQRMSDNHLSARAWLLLASAAGMRGDYEQAERACRHAEALMSRLSLPARMRATLHNTLGLVHYNLGRYDKAAKQLNNALRLRIETLGPEHLEVARSNTNLGNLARARGQYEQALKHHRRARAIDRVQLGEQHPNEARHLHNIARIFFLRGDRPAALQRYQRALALKKQLLGPRHTDVALTYNSLGLVYFDAGDLSLAEHHYDKALEILGEKRHIDAGVARYNLGLLQMQRRAPGAALRHYEQALPIYEELLGRGHRRVAELLLAIGDAHRVRGEHERAAAAYQRAHQIALQLPDGDALATQIEAARKGALPPDTAPAPPPSPAAPAAPQPAPAPAPQPPLGIPPLTSLGMPAPPPRPAARPMPQPAPAPAPVPPRPIPRGAYGSGQAWD